MALSPQGQEGIKLVLLGESFDFLAEAWLNGEFKPVGRAGGAWLAAASSHGFRASAVLEKSCFVLFVIFCTALGCFGFVLAVVF